MNRAPILEANSAISLDLPIRRRPRQVTSEDTLLPHNPSKLSSSLSRPMKLIFRFIFLYLLNGAYYRKSRPVWQ
jgi:hypothetical protein